MSNVSKSSRPLASVHGSTYADEECWNSGQNSEDKGKGDDTWWALGILPEDMANEGLFPVSQRGCIRSWRRVGVELNIKIEDPGL